MAGPLNADEIYFAHTLWLINQGKQQYIDFASGHLPAYFLLLEPLVRSISTAPTDLSFLWGVRSLSGVIVAGYLGLAWALGRSAGAHWSRIGTLGAGALLLVFVVLARMVEVRADTGGLLLVNAAWVLVLGGLAVRRLVAAAVLAGLALLFSARAPGMVGVFGLLLLSLTVRARDWRGVRALLCVAGGFLAVAAVAYLAAPEWVTHVVRSCFVGPVQVQGTRPTMSLATRFFQPARIPLTLLIVGGLFAGVRLLRTGRSERGVIVTVACAAQLLMVALDPLPFEYVYGWAAVPAVFGLVSVSPRWSSSIPLAFAAALMAGAIGYTLRGESPPATSLFHLTLDPPLREDELARLPTPELVSLLVTDKGQRSLTGQLRVRSEVCRRLGGTVIAGFDTNPVCLHDALSHWVGVGWPPVVEGDLPVRGAMSHETFGRQLREAGPSVFIWAHRWESPRPVLPATRQMLECCYDIHDGFALKKAAR